MSKSINYWHSCQHLPLFSARKKLKLNLPFQISVFCRLNKGKISIKFSRFKKSEEFAAMDIGEQINRFKRNRNFFNGINRFD